MDEKPKREGALAARWEDVMVVWKLLWDREVDFSLKVIPIAAVLYLIFPFDFLPDIALGLGQLDDLGILLLAFATFLRMVPPAQVERARLALGHRPGDPSWIDGEAHYKKDEDK